MKTLFLIHGRDFKPDVLDLQNLWESALGYGIERDHGQSAASTFSAIKKEFIYYGDLSNSFLTKKGREYNRVKDTDARKETLDRLKKYAAADFSRTTYMELRSRFHGFRRWLVGFLAKIPSLRDVGVSIKMPEMRLYWWKSNKKFGNQVRGRLKERLRGALEAKGEVMIIAHSLGAIVAYDVLSEFSHPEDDEQLIAHSVRHLVTLGSPLGIPFVQKRLRNWRTFPNNILSWDNVTAKDDYVSLDEGVKDDFRDMPIEINDKRIYNLAVKNNKTHQHHATGYLIHPHVASIVHKWMLKRFSALDTEET